MNLRHVTNNCDQVFSITCRLLFIAYKKKKSIFTSFLSIRVVLSCFYTPIFNISRILNLKLTFAVCSKRDVYFKLYINSDYHLSPAKLSGLSGHQATVGHSILNKFVRTS